MGKRAMASLMSDLKCDIITAIGFLILCLVFAIFMVTGGRNKRMEEV